MKRDVKIKLVKKWGTATGNLSLVLEVLRAGYERDHPFETKLETMIKDLDSMFSEFVQIYPEDVKPPAKRHWIFLEWSQETVWAEEVSELPEPGSCTLFDGWLTVEKHYARGPQHFACFETKDGWKCKRS